MIPNSYVLKTYVRLPVPFHCIKLEQLGSRDTHHESLVGAKATLADICCFNFGSPYGNEKWALRYKIRTRFGTVLTEIIKL